MMTKRLLTYESIMEQFKKDLNKSILIQIVFFVAFLLIYSVVVFAFFAVRSKAPEFVAVPAVLLIVLLFPMLSFVKDGISIAKRRKLIKNKEYKVNFHNNPNRQELSCRFFVFEGVTFCCGCVKMQVIHHGY